MMYHSIRMTLVLPCPGATGRQQAKRVSTLAGILSARHHKYQLVLEVASAGDPAFAVYTKNKEANDLVGYLHG